MSGRFRGISAAFLSVFFGSTYSIFSKYLLQFTIPETLILLSILFSLATLLLFFGLIPEIKGMMRIDKKTMLAILGVTLFSSVLQPLLFMKGLNETLAINAIVASRLSPIFLGIIGFVFLKERCTWQWMLGTGCMFLGIIYITTKGFTLGISADTGVLFVALSALISACGSIVYKKYLFHVKPELVLFLRFLFASIFFLFLVPILLNIHHDMSISMHADTWMYFVGLALIPIVLGIYLWYEALDNAPASLVGAIDLLKPISGMVLAYLFLHEGLYTYHAWGTLLILVGLGINFVKKVTYTPTEVLKNVMMFMRGR